LQGQPAMLVLAGFLFVLSCQAIGALLALLLKPVAVAVSIATLLTAPAFGFMGIGFPRLGMNAFAYGYGEMLPGTWYLMARIDQTIRGTPVDLSWKPILVLLGFVIVLLSLTAVRVLQMRRASEVRAP
jgi:ABC-2 type transport system permease protein